MTVAMWGDPICLSFTHLSLMDKCHRNTVTPDTESGQFSLFGENLYVHPLASPLIRINRFNPD
jgi:hypothetical protein